MVKSDSTESRTTLFLSTAALAERFARGAMSETDFPPAPNTFSTAAIAPNDSSPVRVPGARDTGGARARARAAWHVRRIGFLFNHDQTHQVAHSLPIALALADSGFSGDIVIATTNKRLTAEVRRLGGNAIGSSIRLVELRLSRAARRAVKLFGPLVPAAKLLVYRDNLAFFRTLDMLVVPEKTSLVLKSRYGLDGLRIVHTRHGAGDRAIGFDAASAGFDHVMCAGPKIRDRLIGDARIGPEQISIVGYPKFDLARDARLPAQLVRDGRPVVLYNPHPSPHLSSWYRHGRAVLEFFLAHPEYQLIFAPHVMLFQRSFVVTIDRLRVHRAGHLDERFLRAPNIHVDPGSSASTDMSYTQVADLYLGDVSSQVYEFLHRPRPCLFLNSHRREWQGDANFGHWRAGPVITSPAMLQSGLREAIAGHDRDYRQRQEAMFARTFDLTDEPSSRRAARVILDLAARIH